MDHICLSGGAIGADTVFGECATRVGHSVFHFSFKKHKLKGIDPNQIVMMSEEELISSDIHCEKASIALKRHFPPKSLFVQNLLRRNWFQVRVAESVYAVAGFKDGMVTGGTAWAVQMAIDRFVPCPIYVFDQENCWWTEWTGSDWKRIYEPPPPTGVYAGIGSRDLLPQGKWAIWVLFNHKGLRNAL